MVMGGDLASGTLQINSIGAGAVLGYLTLISSVPFAFWSVLLKYNRVSMIAPFNVVMPVAGTVLSAVWVKICWASIICLPCCWSVRGSCWSIKSKKRDNGQPVT